jgi:lipopolysaccharide/colanic/teichoic acid biosynthesis glycosyltransferase
MGRPRASTPAASYEATKRAFDVWVSLALLPIALPLIALAALAVVLTTRQNPLFLQTRVGLHGRPFRMIKLRTMRAASAEPATSKRPDDPRVTAIGRVLRRTSLDELPQLLNVLAGQMSLVGPRPALPAELAEQPRSWRRALDVKPGLTGLWQVRGRSELSLRRRAVLDRCYIRRRSMAFDALILLSTVRAVASMRGAW